MKIQGKQLVNMKTDMCKPRRETWNVGHPQSPQKEPILVPDFSQPEWWENKFLLLTSPHLWYFVTAAITNLPLGFQITAPFFPQEKNYKEFFI